MKFFMTSGAVVINNAKRGWELPGGQVEQGETIKEAVLREVKEETGIDIELLKFCGVSQETVSGICNFWWLGTPISNILSTSCESLDVGYYQVEEALEMIKYEQFKEELLQCLHNKIEPFFLTFSK
ncbi:NUDIX hydrolase [Niallia sp. 03133]|uniref:NUDIX hydrolase n=1 Tax=Niallia sp. 03133 TaxID=3458060 RepID=UPI0040447D49